MAIIYDTENGKQKIRNCEHNYIELGFWGTLWHFNNHWIILKRFDIMAVLDAIKTILLFFIFIAIFPLIPFISAYYTVKKG